MKKTIKLLVLLCMVSFILSGCGIFKKKCNCPKMGMEKVSHQLGLAETPAFVIVFD